MFKRQISKVYFERIKADFCMVCDGVMYRKTSIESDDFSTLRQKLIYCVVSI
ncbi:hypothetical protein VDIAB_220212 [Vibrio diabolicus]|nr:hypothetical protein VDIAB_220212 [Vibrio diabolicus]